MRGSGLSVLILLLTLGAGPAWAQTGSSSTASAGAPQAHATTATRTAAGAAAKSEGAWVRIAERRVFQIRVGRGNETAAQRAGAASKALVQAAHGQAAAEPHLEDHAGRVVIMVGELPLVQLGPEDAAAAGDASLEVHAKGVAAEIKAAIEAERTRSKIAETVFSFSLLVFSGLMAFLVLRRLGELVERSKKYLEANPDRLAGLQFSGIEVITPATLKAGFITGVSLGARLLQLAVVYLWLLVSLSLFDATREQSERLTGLVFSPISQLAVRLGRGFPIVIVGLVALVAVGILVRFVGLFFESVDRGETRLSWVPGDLAASVSVVVRFGIILLALVFGAPLLTGSSDTVSSITGIAALSALALASAPVLASAIVGVLFVFGRRVRLGDYVELGAVSGKVRALTLLDVRLEDEHGHELRVPYLRTLIDSARVYGRADWVSIDLPIDPSVAHQQIEPLLLEVASGLGERPSVLLDAIDSGCARYRVQVASRDRGKTRTLLYAKSVERLQQAGIKLGRPGGQ